MLYPGLCELRLVFCSISYVVVGVQQEHVSILTSRSVVAASAGVLFTCELL